MGIGSDGSVVRGNIRFEEGIELILAVDFDMGNIFERICDVKISVCLRRRRHGRHKN